MVQNPKAKKGVEICYQLKGEERCLNLSLFSNEVLNWFFSKYFYQFIEFKDTLEISDEELQQWASEAEG